MKRNVILSLSAVVVAAMVSSVSFAQTVDVALNLRYTDPNTEASGGTWELVAKTDDADGLAGLSAYLSDAGTTADFVSAYLGTTPATAGVQMSTDFGGSGTLNVVVGSDLDPDGSDTAGLGTGAGSNGNQLLDPLTNAAWDNVALLASGTFGANRPAFAVGSPGANDVTDANNHNAASLAGTGGADAAGTVNTSVRGDGVSSDGLLDGDTNRDGTVDVTDLGNLATNWGLSPRGWDDGDFNSDTAVDVTDLGDLATNWGLSWSAPAISAVPEPTSVVLGLLGALMVLGGRRRV